MDDNSSDSSIVEIEIEKKFPPVVHLDEDEIILNLNVSSEPCVDPISNPEVTHECLSLSKSSRANDPDHWTEDMTRFYNDDWGGEESFVVKNLQEKMNKDPNLWKVSNKDLLNLHCKKRQSKLKCWNCCQHGHTISNCPDPIHEIKCHMCGGLGHRGDSCPNAKCLNCGAASKNFVNMCNKCIRESKKKCLRCNMEGHYFINCTDHWRRYHCTIKTKEIKRPEYNVNKPSDQLWCCNCGKKGHHQARCKSKKNLPAYPDALPFIASYDDLFASPVKNTENGNKRKRYFEENSGKELEKIDNIFQNIDRSSDEITVLFERKEKRPADNPFKNWEEWFAREKRKNKNKKKGKRQMLMGNCSEKRKKNNRIEFRGGSALNVKKTRDRKDLFIHGNNKKFVRQCVYR